MLKRVVTFYYLQHPEKNFKSVQSLLSYLAKKAVKGKVKMALND